MDPITRFSTKADRYARYRWEYAPEVIQAFINTVDLTTQSIVADIGAGTGILTRELVGKVKTIYAVEPNLAMRRFAEQQLSQYPSFVSIDGYLFWHR